MPSTLAPPLSWPVAAAKEKFFTSVRSSTLLPGFGLYPVAAEKVLNGSVTVDQPFVSSLMMVEER